jgi:hypothetical protein
MNGVWKFQWTVSVRADDEDEANEILSEYIDETGGWDIVGVMDVTKVEDPSDPWMSWPITRGDL